MKIIPPGMSFRTAMKLGYVGRVENEAYLAFVRTLPCTCGCGSMAECAHHPIDVGYGGKKTKCPDYWAIPMTHECHRVLHGDVRAWEEKHGPQLEHAVLTMTWYQLMNRQ